MAAKHACWLMKSEPEAYSIQQLAKDGTTPWDGIRNYQARNFMRDAMRVGDRVLFYHSNTKPPGIVGLAEICREAYPDHTAWDPASPYFDPRSTEENPVWMMVDVRYLDTFDQILSLDHLRAEPKLEGMLVTRKGQRLSIQPVSMVHYRQILKMAGV